MRKYILNAALGAMFCVGSVSAADIVRKLKPPAVKVEHRPERPSPRHVWVTGDSLGRKRLCGGAGQVGSPPSRTRRLGRSPVGTSEGWVRFY